MIWSTKNTVALYMHEHPYERNTCFLSLALFLKRDRLAQLYVELVLDYDSLLSYRLAHVVPIFSGIMYTFVHHTLKCVLIIQNIENLTIEKKLMYN